MAKTPEIKDFWNENPVGSNWISYESDPSFYEKYDEFRYSTEGYILQELDKLDLDEKYVLEIGLGQGADSMQLIKRGAIYYGIDLTEESIRRVEERFALFNMTYNELRVANAEDNPYIDACFDHVYSFGVIHHSPKIEQIVAEIHRVLKPGGEVNVMLYHKTSFNYYISIALLRRVGLLALYLIPGLKKPIGKLTGESPERINKHIVNLKQQGWSYLKMSNFIHRSTDGPDNIFSSVWTDQSARQLFKDFENIETSVNFLNERHLLGLQKILPKPIKRWIARKFGWHLWVKAKKSS